ncbi:T9SS type A sorting domain-containing protein [Ulvibacter antarcticus]|uniref:Putative secreted protein (Por secretion system target) n=1 Tax=Ulvibacter antarcticus TaxID=442714 RepID=A0A3L9YYM0_9FLAO|nr:T9SS type A sorting domain-containing protein [Ulvibacter antarcticus]RMA64159.1 putative secreted protein (Por secretion system target) [Ulvibacter antarcticus]
MFISLIMRILIILLFICSFTQAQIVTIPDANFKYALVNYTCAAFDANLNFDGDVDTNNDGEIQLSEAEAVYALSVGNNGIQSLEGIAAFSNLHTLLCGDNPLTALDLTQNQSLVWVNSWDCQLTSVISANQNLEFLSVSNNQLNTINISENPNLKQLNISLNQFTEIDVSQNYNLEGLGVSENQITSLDVSNNLSLKSLSCSYNLIANLDLSNNSDLEQLLCKENALESLNLKNQNNLNMIAMDSRFNPNLFCINVDDEDANLVCTATFPHGWCKDAWAAYSEDCVLSVDDHEENSISLSPNPVIDVLDVNSVKSIEKIKCYSLDGKLIKQESNSRIDLSILPKGVYIVIISVEGENFVKKIIKN